MLTQFAKNVQAQGQAISQRLKFAKHAKAGGLSPKWLTWGQ